MTEKIYYMSRGRAIAIGIIPTIVGGFLIIVSFFVSGLNNGFANVDFGHLAVVSVGFFIAFSIFSSGAYLVFFRVPLVKITSDRIYYSNLLKLTGGREIPFLYPFSNKVTDNHISFDNIYSFHPKFYTFIFKISNLREEYQNKGVYLHFQYVEWRKKDEMIQTIIDKITQ